MLVFLCSLRDVMMVLFYYSCALIVLTSVEPSPHYQPSGVTMRDVRDVMMLAIVISGLMVRFSVFRSRCCRDCTRDLHEDLDTLCNS